MDPPPTSSSGRLRVQTEKGAMYQQEMKKKAYLDYAKKLTTNGRGILEAVERGKDPSCIQSQYDTWKHWYVELIQTHQVLGSLLEQEEKEKLQTEHCNLLQQLNAWKEQIETFLSEHREPTREKNFNPENASQCSNTSQTVRNRILLMKMEETKAAAEKQIQAAMANRQLELQKKREEMEKAIAQEEGQLKMELEKKMSEARMKVLCHVESEGDVPAIEQVVEEEIQQEKKRVIRSEITAEDQGGECVENRPTGEEVGNRGTCSEDPMIQLVKLLSKQKRHSDLPVLEPEVFKGDASKFNLWLNAFETHIEHKTESAAERLHFLFKYTGGEARRAIDGFLHLRTDDAYQLAKGKLVNRFGNDFVIASAYRTRIREWPNIRAGDGHGLRDFADHLEHFLAAASGSLKNLAVLDDHLENQLMLKKLPRHLTDRWRRVVDDWLHGARSADGSRYPPFSEFVRFISLDARIACGPVGESQGEQTRDSSPARRKSRWTSTSPKREVRKCNHIKTAQDDSRPQQDRAKTAQETPCLFCGGAGH